MGLAKYEKASAEIQYGSFYGMFMDISEKQLDAVRKNKAFTDTGLMWDCGIVESGSNIGLAAVDDAAARLCAFGKRTEREASLKRKMRSWQTRGCSGRWDIQMRRSVTG